MIRSRSLPSTATAALLSLLLAVPPATAAVPAAPAAPGAATPQDLVARMLAAAETKNMAEMARCLDPESRLQFSMGLLMATTMMVAFMGMGAGMAEGMMDGMAGDMSADEKAKMQKGKAEAAEKMTKAKTSYSALLKKHGLPDLMDEKALPQNDGAAADILSKVDQGALAADLFAFMEQIGDKKELTEGKGPLPAPRNVTDYVIKGDTATAKAGGDVMDFVKVDGRWYFKLPAKPGMSEEAPSSSN